MLKIDWALNHELCNCKDTLTKISFDDEHQESMITSKTRVVDFDKVKTNYLNSMRLDESCRDKIVILFVCRYKRGN